MAFERAVQHRFAVGANSYRGLVSLSGYTFFQLEAKIAKLARYGELG